MKNVCRNIVGLLLLAGLSMPVALAKTPLFWQDSAYAIECTENSIRNIIQDFGKSFGVEVVISERVGGSCQGWKRSENAEEFLDALSIEYAFTWYVFNNTLYINSVNQNVVTHIDMSQGVFEALKAVGLVQPKFGWGMVEDSDVAIVSGPPSYIEQVETIANNLLDNAEMQKTEESDKAEMIYVIPLKYASVQDRETVVRSQVIKTPGVANILASMLGGSSSDITTKDTPSGELLEISSSKNESLRVQSDVRTNSIIIKSNGKPIEYFKAIIDTLDEPQSLIEIDAVIIDIDREKMKEIGLNLKVESQIKGGRSVAGGGDFNSGLVASGAQAANAMFNIPNLAKFYANLKLLENSGDATIIANTSILTVENQPAFIDLSSTFYIRASGERVANILPVTTGTLLNVVPQSIETNEGKKIKLFIDIEDGTIQTRTIENLPIVTRSAISTKAVVPEGNTLVIGGYHRQSTSKRVNKVPGLGNVPVVKHLFTNKENVSEHTERIFILTPRISPASHNPQDYLMFDSSNSVATSAVSNIRRRWHAASRSLVDKNILLLESMLQGSVPEGYANRRDMSAYSSVECRSDGLSFTPDNSDVVYGQGIAVFRFNVVNKTSLTRTVYEHSCFGKGLISVVNAGQRKLHPDQSTTILVSVEIDMLHKSLGDFYGDDSL